MCNDFNDTTTASIDCDEFVNQPCKCGEKMASVGLKCVGDTASKVDACDKMYPDEDSLTEVCKCGND